MFLIVYEAIFVVYITAFTDSLPFGSYVLIQGLSKVLSQVLVFSQAPAFVLSHKLQVRDLKHYYKLNLLWIFLLEVLAPFTKRFLSKEQELVTKSCFFSVSFISCIWVTSKQFSVTTIYGFNLLSMLPTKILVYSLNCLIHSYNRTFTRLFIHSLIHILSFSVIP